MPMVSGFMSRRERIAEAMGVAEKELLQRFRDARTSIAMEKIVRQEAVCQHAVHSRGIDLHRLVPISAPIEHDNGRYITAGLVIARNSRTGVQNVSINRIQVHAHDRMTILLLPRHLHAFIEPPKRRPTGAMFRSLSASIR
jgi:2,5-furandicarboxylate decarboxylase 1